MKTHTFICFCNALQAFLGGLAMLLLSQSAQAQVQNMIVHRTDGTKVMFNVEQVDSVTFEEVPRWANRSVEARKLLAYLDEGAGKRMLSGVHACINYNTYEADWVYKHTGKYPAINCIDFIHNIYSSKGGWIDYTNQTIWKNWTNKRGIMAAMWHWGMPTNDGTTYTCTPGTADGETSFSPSAIFDPTSDGYKMMIQRIDQIATWMKPMAAARVPIIWRPLHEAQGNWSDQYPGTSWHKAWFWWGIDGPEAFVELWKVMYDRMVNYHGLTNLIWVYNAGDSMKWYPGDEYVEWWLSTSTTSRYQARVSGINSSRRTSLAKFTPSASLAICPRFPNCGPTVSTGVSWCPGGTMPARETPTARPSTAQTTTTPTSTIGKML